jgi:uncharacterized protein involved in response to NO
MSRLLPPDTASTSSSAFALFNLAFRPFFLFGALFSLLAILAWGLMFSGKVQFDLYGGQMWWHIHEMLFGFVVAIVVGFLLTAVQNWSGVPGLKGKLLFGLFLIWLAARILMFFPAHFDAWIIALVDLLFLPAAAAALAYPIIKTKLWRNLMFIPILLAMTAANWMLHKAVIQGQIELLYSASNSMIFLVVLVMCILGGRVFPMFTANGTRTQRVNSIFALEALSIISIVLVLLLNSFSFDIPSTAKSSLYFITALIHGVRVFRWKIWVTFKTPLVWSLHLSYWCIVFGLLLLGISESFDWATRSQAIHTLTIGAMSGMILSMISRVSLGHTGRIIAAGNLMTLAFIALFLAFVVRIFGLILITDYILVIIITATLWSIAFGCFIWQYFPILVSRRTDGQPG